jgi:hypothetical protein
MSLDLSNLSQLGKGTWTQLGNGALLFTPGSMSGGFVPPGWPQGQGIPPGLDQLLQSVITQALGGLAGGGAGGVGGAAIGVLFALAHALKNKMQKIEPGSNPEMEQFDQQFWQLVLGGLAKPAPQPMAG